MSIWKKAVSTLATAGLLASLLGTAVAGTALANSAPMALNGSSCVPSSCTQVVSSGSISIHGATNTSPFPAATKLTISGAGASFISASGGAFTLETGTDYTGGTFYLAGEVKVSTSVMDYSTNTVVVVGTSAGSATITEWQWLSSQNLWAPDGNSWSLSFTAAASYQVSAAKSTLGTFAADCSTAKTSASSTAASNVAYLCGTITNAAGTGLQGVALSGTITPYGTMGSGQQVWTATTDASGDFSTGINASGVAGVTTITASASFLNVTTALPSTTFTFTGSLASLTASNVRYVYAQGETASKAIKLVGKDAAGNKLDLTSACVIGGINVTGALTGLTLATSETSGDCYLTASTSASASFGTESVSFTSGTVTSNSVKLGVSGTAATMSAAFDKTTVVPGGTALFTATLKDSAGRPAPDGDSVLTVASSGIAVSSTGSTSATTLNGVATFTYLAPFNTGVASVTAFNSDAGNASATISVSVPTPVAATSNASALGKTLTGPFDTATKVAAKGAYVTFKMSFGAADAGKTITIYKAAKSASGTWGSWVKLTTRVANASGDVFVYVTSGGAWLSIRGNDGSVWTPAVQARWQ